MTPIPGSSVRLLVDLIADDGTILPSDSRAMVIGHQGDRLIVEVVDEYGERHSATCQRWEVRA